MKEITFEREGNDDEEQAVLSAATLKGCRENSLLSMTKKRRFYGLEEKVKRLSKDPKIRKEAEGEVRKKGRLVSQSELAERDSQSKTVRTVSSDLK